MDDLSRRKAIGLGVAAGSALLSPLDRASAEDEPKVIVARDNPVLIKFKDVLLERAHIGDRTINVSIGQGDVPLKLVNLPLAEDINLRMSFEVPSIANNLPFEWKRLLELEGKRVSMQVLAKAGELSVNSIAWRND